jgi:hypothetical protein
VPGRVVDHGGLAAARAGELLGQLLDAVEELVVGLLALRLHVAQVGQLAQLGRCRLDAIASWSFQPKSRPMMLPYQSPATVWIASAGM